MSVVPHAPTESSALSALRELRLRLKRRLAFLSWVAEQSGQEADSLVHVLSEETGPDCEQDWCQNTPEIAPLNRTITALAEQLGRAGTRFRQLCDAFELSELEACTLKAAVALALEPNLMRGLAALDGQAGSHGLLAAHVAQLFGREPFVLPASSALLRWRLLECVKNGVEQAPTLQADPAIVAWLGGAALEDPELLHLGTTPEPKPALPGWPLARAVQLIASISGSLRLRIAGVPGSGRKTFAALIAAELNSSLYAVDVAELQLDAEKLRACWLRACRRVRLTGELLAWCGPLPTDASGAPRRMLLITPVQDDGRSQGPGANPVIELPLPEPDTRKELWLAALPEARDWPVAELDALALQHRATIAEIAAVANLGVSSAREASLALRETSRGVLSGLAQRLECSFTFNDLLAPPAVKSALDDLLFEARERLLVWEDPKLRRLFPLGTGLLALFCGPPGTGKTMSAQVLASELGLDLYRIDLSTIVSKYVGETTKNLERVLATAARMDVILFFDEADSLFGKRTDIRDAHDRYANTDTNYLLQAVEAFKGIAVLATNRKGNVDSAFLRRLRHVIDYPAPDANQRLELWHKLVSAIAGEPACRDTASVLPALAAAFELSGAQIKYAVLHSLYSARREQQPVRVRHLVSGVERELQKLGRGISRGEANRLLALEGAALS